MGSNNYQKKMIAMSRWNKGAIQRNTSLEHSYIYELAHINSNQQFRLFWTENSPEKSKLLVKHELSHKCNYVLKKYFF